jgi:RNA polymerase sigma factor (sigma-70 family)
MRLLDDTQLLSAYATQQSEEAFATLVERYVSLVYSSALRQVGDPDLAEEITQVVFILLARKAGTLGGKTVLAGWLCRTARYTACNALKARHRRRHREQEAYMESQLHEPVPDVWPQLAPLLDEAVARLGEADRNAIVLRYYRQMPLEEVSKALGLNADAAQKRVSRALEKLRKFFARRGVVSTADMIAGAISANSVQASSAALAKTVTAAAIAKGAGASASTAALIKGTKGVLKVMGWTTAKKALVAAVVLILAAGTTTRLERNRISGARMDQAKRLAFEFILFADANGGRLPDNFDGLQSYASDNPDTFTGIYFPTWEIVSGGNANSIANPAHTILVREKEPRQAGHGTFVKAYAFADGHAELIYSPDKDFAALEKRRGFLAHPAKN